MSDECLQMKVAPVALKSDGINNFATGREAKARS